LGNQLRVTAQLIDAETDAHLWAERFDGDTSDLFALQDEITNRIASTLDVELIAAEAARPTENPDALDYILRGRAARLKTNSRESFVEAIGWYERALTLDPRAIEAQTRLAAALVARALSELSDRKAADLARADGLIGQALAASPRNAFAHHVKGQLLRGQLRWAEAIPEYETALALNRNSMTAMAGLGWCKLYSGLLDEAIPFAEKAIRLSPRDLNHDADLMIGTVHLLKSCIEEAIVWLEKGRNRAPGLPLIRGRLAAAYALKGEAEHAAAELAEARRLAGGDLFKSIASVKAGGAWAPPKTLILFEPWFAGLRLAGMPEQ
jgi:tetratricopeptide (TPR) repeat protein